MADLARLRRQLEIDEAVRRRVYKDSEGLLTVGIGHLIKSSDPSWLKNAREGDAISKTEVNDLFEQDLAVAMASAKIIFEDVWDTFPDIIQEVFINMVFNLGATRFLKFKKTIMYAYEARWDMVSVEMLDSKWADQVGPRAKRLSIKVASCHKPPKDMQCH